MLRRNSVRDSRRDKVEVHTIDSDLERRGTRALEYRADIDGLRALAVIAVVGFHAFPEAIPGGFVGVDVFFVISGFLISALIFKHLSRSDFTLRDFYARRARRILPALCLVLAACLLFGFFVLLPDEFAKLGKHAAAAAAFAANIAFWRESGYFAPAAQFEPLLHLWSLGIEEQFYLLWPLIVLGAWRFKARIPLIVALITAGSFALNIVLDYTSSTANFYFPLCRFWELGLGCLLAAMKAFPGGQGTQSRQRPGSVLLAAVRPLATVLPAVGAAAIIIACVCFNSHMTWPGFATLIPTVGAMCVIAGPEASWFNRKALAHRPLVFVGLISYPLYLWHWPILSFAAVLDSGTPQIALRTAAVFLSFMLAVLTFRFIELPIQMQRQARVSLGLVAYATVLGVVGLSVCIEGGFADRFNVDTRAAVSQVPKKDSLCTASVGEQYQFNYCRRTNLDAPKVVFLGDSQAQGVYEGVVSMLGRDRPMLLLGRGGCPPVLHVQPSVRGYGTDSHRRTCNETWNNFVEYVRESRPQMVVLVGVGARFFTGSAAGTSSDTKVPDTSADARAFKDGLDDLVENLRPYTRVTYMLEIPTFDSAPACFLRPVKLPGGACSPSIERHALVASRSGYTAAVREVQREHPDLIVIDSIPSLCNATSCSQMARTGQVLYRDQLHLSPAGGQRLAKGSGLTRLIANVTG